MAAERSGEGQDVRGIVVRSRSLIGNIGAGLQTLFGGNITLYTQLNEVAAGVTEVLATAPRS